jgi:pimeloyl-ACP methyl ester carboxylesterase
VAREHRATADVNVELHHLPLPAGKVAVLDYEPRRPRGVALAVGHGYSSSKHNLDVLCAFLASHGFNVLSVDFPGHKLGASGGRLSSIDDLTAAMDAAVRFARERYTPVVYTMGHSMGATTALRACAADDAVAGAISIATGWGRPRALTALSANVVVDLRAGYVDGLTLPELAAQTEPVLGAALARLAGRPCLYVAADRDAMVSRASADELFERAPEPKTFAVIASDHTYAGENARGTVLAWLNEFHPRAGAPEAAPEQSVAL